MSYDNIDPILNNYCSISNIVILEEDSDVRRRYFYISNKYAQTIQVVVEPEVAEIVRIDIHPIEEISDEFHIILCDIIDNFSELLELSVFTVRKKLKLV